MSIGQLARSIADEVDAREIPKSPVAITVPASDDPLLANAEKLGYAEGQSFVIEYKDSTGKQSTRRITVYGFVSGAAGIPSLIAHCHERQAQRQFRVDRIQCFIDYDGEVFSDVPAFLVENFGMDASFAKRKVEDRDRRWLEILETIKHEAVLLSALARVDGKTVAVEVDAATDYLARAAERAGVMLDEAEILSIYRYANRLRPTEDAIMRALQHAGTLDQSHIRRLLLAAARIIDADGRRHPREIALINAIATDLIGAEIL